jgi:hypothetical protein
MLNAETPTMSKHITFSIRRKKSGKICGQISAASMLIEAIGLAVEL